MPVKPRTVADFNFAAAVLEFIRKEPVQPYEQGGMVDATDLLQCFDHTLERIVTSYAEKIPSDVEGLERVERSINSALPALMSAYAERHRVRYLENPATGFRFSASRAASASPLREDDELAERLCALGRLLGGSHVRDKKEKILTAASGILRQLCNGSERVDAALKVLVPLVGPGRLSPDLAKVLLVSALEKPGDFEFFDAGGMRLAEAVAVFQSGFATELYWHLFLNRALRYADGVRENSLLLQAVRSSDAFWQRAARSVSRTKHVWDLRVFRARLKFREDGSLYAGTQVRPHDKARQHMIALIDGIEDAGVKPDDLLPMPQDLIREAMARHAPAGEGAINDESSWVRWALAAARSVQLAELFGFITRFHLEGGNHVHAWLMRRWLSDGGGAYRAAALDALVQRSSIPRARADRFFVRVSFDADEILGAWQGLRESGKELPLADFIRIAAYLQEYLVLKMAGRAAADEPEELGLIYAVARQLGSIIPELSSEAVAPAKAEHVPVDHADLSSDEMTWAQQIADPSARSLILTTHASAVESFALAADLRTKIAEEDVSDLVRNLLSAAGAAMALPGEDVAAFVNSTVGLAATACCHLVAREMQLDRFRKYSDDRILKFIAHRFADIAARPVFAKLLAALPAAAAANFLKDAQLLRMGKGYDAVGLFTKDERLLLQSSLKQPFADVSDLVAHWDQACTRLQRCPAFDDAFFTSAELLSDVERASAVRATVGGGELGSLVWKARRTWAILALRNGLRIRSLRAISNRMASFQPVLRHVPFGQFRVAMTTHGPDEVPLNTVIQYYAAKQVAPAAETVSLVPEPASPTPEGSEEPVAEAPDAGAGGLENAFAPSAEGAAQAALAGGLGIARLAVKL